MQSFLNLIELSTGRQLRLAEFGFTAEAPSFTDSGIIFSRDGELWSFDMNTGRIKRSSEVPCPVDKDTEVKINFISQPLDGIGHCELIAGGRIIARFMGSLGSIGSSPCRDGRVVFIGYPSPDGIN